MNTRIFINEVKSRRPLWDYTDQDYHNKKLLNELWSEVAALFDVEVQAAKQKWKNLRDTFRVELKKKKKYVGNSDHRNSWAFYQDMIFLKDILKTRKLRDLLEPRSTSFNEEADEEAETVEDSIKVEPEMLYSPSHLTDDTITENDSNTAASFQPQLQDIDITNSKLSRGIKRKSDQEDLENEEQDDDLLFFRSLLPFVKKLDQDKKLLFRMNVQQTLYNHLYN